MQFNYALRGAECGCKAVGPIYDQQAVDHPIKSWSAETEASCYPPKNDPYDPAEIPQQPATCSDRYLRPSLAKNERLRLSMLWYHTRDILDDTEFLSGLQEKASFAQESSGWEFAVIGIQDLNYYIRLATVGLQLGILPRGETICAHTVTQPPNLMEDWRFEESPYLESGGLRGYAGAPLRLQHKTGECVNLGTLCVASSTKEEPLTRSQQMTLVRLADWIVSDIVKCARARRQQERQRMTELIATAQDETNDIVSEKPVLSILRIMYSDAVISIQPSNATHIQLEGQDRIPISEFEHGLWEDTEFIDDFIENANNREFPSTRAVRALSAHCENISGQCLLVVATKNFQLVFDDIDSWFVQTCAGMITKMWHKHILAEVMETKEKFLRGFSHQLRTPLHGIIGSVELLAEELGMSDLTTGSNSGSHLTTLSTSLNSSGSSAHLNIIKTAGRDLVSIVNSMITLNRWADIALRDRQHSTHTIFELENGLANEILKEISGDKRYTASVFFSHELPLNCDTFKIDLELLRDSLTPVILNAIQNTPGGVVTITTSVLPESKQFVIDVVDTGRGIHPDDHQRIFEPYERVGAHSTGAGLGLTLSSKFAGLLHGSVSLVSSDVNQGSHFRAVFKEIEHFPMMFPSLPLASVFNNIPPKFYNLTPERDELSLSSLFTKYLTSNKFASSSAKENCFGILDLVSDAEAHHASLSRFPSDQVVICLVPAAQNHACIDNGPENVIYARGPFLRSTMTSALQQADSLVPNLKSAPERLAQSIEQSLALQQMDEHPIPSQAVVSVNEPSYSKSWSPGLHTNDPLPPSGSQKSIPFKHRTEQQHIIESNLIIPISSPLTNPPRPTALIVDDNAVNLRILQMYCSKRGLPYCRATDGLQAVDTFYRHQSSPVGVERAAIQLILMDLQMPGCDGIEATRRIRSLEKENKWRESVIIIITGQDSPTDRNAAEGAGAEEYFVKPVGIKVLDRGIKQYFDAFEV
ncbi:hypothetical protein MYU51_016689 [Penicillium brevicompactum]